MRSRKPSAAPVCGFRATDSTRITQMEGLQMKRKPKKPREKTLPKRAESEPLRPKFLQWLVVKLGGRP